MSKSILKFTKIRDVKSPQRGTPKSAGIDFFVPKFTEQFLIDLELKNPQVNAVRSNEYEYIIERDRIILAPHAQLVIPSGIKIIGNTNMVYPFMNKSGIATKRHLNRTAEVVDEDYGGELHIAIQNTSNNMIVINEDDKIIQLLELHCEYSELTELSNDEYDAEFAKMNSVRGAGGFGSTGTK